MTVQEQREQKRLEDAKWIFAKCQRIKAKLLAHPRGLQRFCKEFAEDKKGRSWQSINRAFLKLEKDGWHLGTLEKYTGIKKSHHDLLGSFGLSWLLVRNWSVATGRHLGEWSKQHGYPNNMMSAVLSGARDTVRYANFVGALQREVLPWERGELVKKISEHQARIKKIDGLLTPKK